MGEGPPVDLARQRRAAADVPGVHRPNLRCRNGIGEEGHPGLRAVRQAHHPRPRRLLRGVDPRRTSTWRPASRPQSTPNGIVTQDGRQIDLDVIIYATGYHLDFLSTVDIRGRDGKKLADEWGDSPRAYRGRHGSWFSEPVHQLGAQLQPRTRCGSELLDGGAGALHHRVPAVDGPARRHHHGGDAAGLRGYVAGIDEAMSRTVWCHTPNAHTYYRSGSGRVVVATPYRLVDVWHAAPGPGRRGLHAAMTRKASRQNGFGHRQQPRDRPGDRSAVGRRGRHGRGDRAEP